MPIFVISIAASVLGLAVSQDKSIDSAPIKTLSVRKSTQTDVPIFSAFLPARCDSAGDLYFQLGDSGSYNAGVVMRLQRDSNQPKLYKAPSDQSGGLAFSEFTVTPAGKVLLLEQTQAGGYEIIRFDSDKDEPTQTAIDSPKHLEATDFAASESGVLMIGGYFDKHADAELQGRAFVGFFGPGGKLIRDLNQESYVKLKEVRMSQHDGATTTGPDGNFYFAHASEVDVLSGYGDLVRTISIQKPDPDATVAAVAVTGDLLSLQFYKTDKSKTVHSMFLVMSPATGDLYSSYVPSPELGDNCVCFSGHSGYTFLRTEKGKLKFLSAPLS